MKQHLFALALAVFAAVSIGSATDADAQIVVDVGFAPPAAYIATVTPEYYEGRPVYFYNDQWYYRDHGRWMYYRHEPAYLHGRRDYWVHRPGYRGAYRGGPAYRGGGYHGGYHGGGRYHYHR